MKRCLSLMLFFSLSLIVSVFAGQQTQPAQDKNTASTDKQSTPQKDKDEVVRISVTLVQIDAVVTDGKGRQVTDLKAEDFEVYEDGRRQHITNFNYIAVPSASAPQPAPADIANKNAPPGPPVNLRPEQVRRTIALVVDDLGLSFESTAHLRDSLKKFVNEQMQPGDLVAIIRTGAGMGALQQFTADKRQLYAAIERVKWNPMGRGGVSALAPIEPDPQRRAREERMGRGGREQERDEQRQRDTINQLREDIFAVGTLGALNFVVRGLRDLPGRKSVILFSDGFRLFNRDNFGESNQRILESLRRLTDLANRASVVVYTIDTRGLQTLVATAADASTNPEEMTRKLNERRDEFYDTQEGLNYLANETGGLFFRNTNDLNRGISRVLEDQKGYYLLGYMPESSTFKSEKGLRKFHKLSVKVKRAGLKVRTRTGFFGIANEEERPAPRTPAQQLLSALISPFASGDIHLKLTSVFGHDAKAGSYVSSMLHIEGKDLTLAEEEGGFHKGIVNIAAFTFSDNGRIVDQNSRTYTLRMNDEQYHKVLKQGFLYTIVVPVKKPGAYQLRVAVRDDASERVGSANQFIEVPDINKNRLALSGIVASASDPSELNKPRTDQASASAEGAVDAVDPQASPSVRKFRGGMLLDYIFVIYNAQLDRATTRPQLESQMIMLRDGKPVFTGKLSPIDSNQLANMKQVVAGGRIQLGINMEPGEYVLQIMVIDKLAKEKYNTTTQWIDFEIVK
ncbi:MAG TPA: VWA domain-containing protein [Blastocatellia bacterium]|nr:VWA domain-containing protein [Blastocatellia bacterium]